MRNMFSSLLLGAAVAACGSNEILPPSDVAASIQAIRANSPGYDVVVRLTSTNGATVSYCTSEVQRKVAGGWMSVGVGQCLDIYNWVLAGGSIDILYNSLPLHVGDSVRFVPHFVGNMPDASGVVNANTNQVVGAASDPSIVQE